MLLPKIIQPRNHPFPFLLYVEWALLGLTILNEFTPSPLPKYEGDSFLAILVIISFGILGLRLPTQSYPLKIAHEIFQFILVMLASGLSVTRLRLLPALLVVVVLRSCLVFPFPGRLVVSALSLLCFFVMAQNQLQHFSNELPQSLIQEIAPQIAIFRLNLLFIFILLLAFLLWLINALLTERQQQDELRQANQKLQDSAARIEKLAMAQERTRIAREIHDVLVLRQCRNGR
ncbi:hypothetical protein [Roseofilum casamattae]|uniref:Signal transduction histidine kinase subgroup 3 dimerisation and phosphoacceptor domain-containing protein n=1 Tax=Roseofilum casamattae BLCC-M143 TaxID=3022442 RepID=A0ABT7BZF8_9CYAN|nr:hypothetical protein [Roseofilum casamattae]MDJ1184592.1 hypothetical protein [Roseofilum casamattae BLCC-M143]